MGDEAVGADRDQLADEGVRLHAGARADGDAALDLHERTDEHLVAERAAIEVRGLHHGDVGPEGHVDDACLQHASHAASRDDDAANAWRIHSSRMYQRNRSV